MVEGVSRLVLAALAVVLIGAPALYLMFLALLGMGPATAIVVVLTWGWVYLLGLLPSLEEALRSGLAHRLNENPSTSE